MSTVGFIAAAFSSNISILILTYGLIGGIGSALIYMPGNAIINSYTFKSMSNKTCNKCNEIYYLI